MKRPESSSRNISESEYRISQRPLLAFSEKTVPENYATVGWEEVQKVLRRLPKTVKSRYFGNRAWKAGEYSSIEWYMSRIPLTQENTDSKFGPQLNADTLFDLYEGELSDPTALKKHFKILMLNTDLNGDENDWGYGLTDAGLGLSIFSAKRFIKEDYPEELALQMWRRLVRHETAHLFGLVNRDFNVEKSLGIHCTNVCCMRQGITMEIWEQLTEEELKAGVEFCSDCEAELQRAVI